MHKIWRKGSGCVINISSASCCCCLAQSFVFTESRGGVIHSWLTYYSLGVSTVLSICHEVDNDWYRRFLILVTWCRLDVIIIDMLAPFLWTLALFNSLALSAKVVMVWNIFCMCNSRM